MIRRKVSHGASGWPSLLICHSRFGVSTAAGDRRIRVGVLREVLQLAAVVRVQLVLRQHDFAAVLVRSLGDARVVEVAGVRRNAADVTRRLELRSQSFAQPLVAVQHDEQRAVLEERTGRQLLDLDANRGARNERHRTGKGTERPIAVSRAKPRDVVHGLVLQLPPAAGVDNGVEKVNAAESQEEAFGQGREGVVGSETAASCRGKNAAKVVSKGEGAVVTVSAFSAGTKLLPTDTATNVPSVLMLITSCTRVPRFPVSLNVAT